jgi:hypothetical protein
VAQQATAMNATSTFHQMQLKFFITDNKNDEKLTIKI